MSSSGAQKPQKQLSVGSTSSSSDQDITSPTGQTKQKHKPPPLNVPSHVLRPPSATNSPTMASSPRKAFFKKTKDDGMDQVLKEVEFEKIFHSLPKYKPEESASTTPLAQSPRGIINVYKQKNKISNLAKGEGQDGDGNKVSSESEAATPTPKTPKSARVDDRRFFGENFNLDLATTSLSATGAKVFDFDGDTNSPRTPKTPTPNSPGTFSTRRILDQRRQLVMQLFDQHTLFPSNQATVAFQNKYSEIFPTKTCLQLKIREVRQKMMASVQNTPKTPTTPSAASSSSSSSEAQESSKTSQPPSSSSSSTSTLQSVMSSSGLSAGQMGSTLTVPMAGQGSTTLLAHGVGPRRTSPMAKSPLAFNSVQ
ncbi:protein capicua homolog [Aplysia californica]|uniref:Protein capicua homolog n=1 Tax=Aplysia californica TaxID=6500 RepID=A0ABM0K7S0_APLCA|nr:protein capicua homolog [Aplysia californica]